MAVFTLLQVADDARSFGEPLDLSAAGRNHGRIFPTVVGNEEDDRLAVFGEARGSDAAIELVREHLRSTACHRHDGEAVHVVRVLLRSRALGVDETRTI